MNVTCDIGFSIQANVKSQYLVCTEQNTWNSTIEDCKRMYMYLFYNFACFLKTQYQNPKIGNIKNNLIFSIYYLDKILRQKAHTYFLLV